ncbi:WhiB family transcriptional regulator [Granulicoccus phenolivorans]|uniref:WhiB family transcriptional regulator n=1 Tax=Granulicoccus phenolivorans TaxID=266854 RepID=UPI000415F57E
MKIHPLRDLAWQEQALCAQTIPAAAQPEVFFPEPGGSGVLAKKICARCAVRVACLDYALETNVRHGIWGGLAEAERTRIRRAAGTGGTKHARDARIRRLADAGLGTRAIAGRLDLDERTVRRVLDRTDLPEAG